MWFGAHLTVFANSSWNLPKSISNPVQLKGHSISLDNIEISKLETKVNYYLGFQLIVPRVGWGEEDSSPSSLNCGPISDHNVPFSTPFSDLPSKIPTCLKTELIWKWLYSVCIFPLPCPRELGIFIFLRILVVVVVTLKSFQVQIPLYTLVTTLKTIPHLMGKIYIHFQSVAPCIKQMFKCWQATSAF